MFTHGAHIGFYSGDVTKLFDDMQTLKPTILPTVPRLLNKVKDKVRDSARSSMRVFFLYKRTRIINGLTPYLF